MPPKEIPDELIDQLLAGREGPEAITGPDGLLKHLTKRVVERATSAELTEHLGYDKHDPAGRDSGNIRNGTRPRTVLIEASGRVEFDVRHDRAGTFEP